jgi:hypothetical protein
MKPILFTAVLLISFVKMSSATDILSVRKMFYNAAGSRSQTEAFMTQLDKAENKNTPVIAGYRGMGYMLLAKHSYNPVTKLSAFSKGKKLLENAILAESRNVELRFLRLSVQLNAPGFLNYSDEIAQDKKLIIEEYKNISDEDLKRRIKDFMAGIKVKLN